MIVTFHHSASGAKQYVNQIKLVLRKACKVVRYPKDTEVAVIFVGDKKMQQLNRIYRNKDVPTNVLTFDTGDIFISVPFAKREAKKQGWPLKYEIVRLTLHGFLHLAGYNHKKNKDAKKMEKIEGKILC